METDEKKIETYKIFKERFDPNIDKWNEQPKNFSLEVGILSLLMVLNDIFLQPYIQSLVSQLLMKKYKELIILCHIFGPQKAWNH